MSNKFLKLMLVTNCRDTPLDSYLRFIRTCSDAGITSIQLREKHLPFRDVIKLGKSIKEIIANKNIKLIVNDSVELALELNADGVHLGQTDGDPEFARKTLGPDKIIGVSINSEIDLDRANLIDLNYVGVGAIFPTKNKTDIAKIWGIEGLNKLAQKSKHPIIAIGGIDEHNAVEALKAGAVGVAGIGIFQDSPQPNIVCKNLIKIVNEIKSEFYEK